MSETLLPLKEALWAASITKEQLAELPAAHFDRSVVLVDSEEGARRAAEILTQETKLGFDTETRPSFRRGQSFNVALLQLSTHSVCFLIRLNKIGLTPEIKSILEDENIRKIGVSIHDDFHNLHKIYSLEPKGFIDLQGFVKNYNIADNSLSRIYAILFGQRISKGQRLTNWEASHLTLHQQEYAALDALACIKIYDHLTTVGFSAVDSPYYRDINATPAPAPKEEPKKAQEASDTDATAEQATENKSTPSKRKNET